MPTQIVEPLLILLLTALFLGLLIELGRFDDRVASPKASQRHPRPLRPRTSEDCPHCRGAAATRPATTARTVVPCVQLKSRRGRKKTINSHGQACPNPHCVYYQITDSAVHALVGYGHLVHEITQRLTLSCFPVFSRDGLALYFGVAKTTCKRRW